MNVVAFVAPQENRSPLADKAESINKQFARLQRAERRIRRANENIASAEMTERYARLNAGRSLIDAKRLLCELDPSASFEAWCAANIRRSMRDCYRCMWIASSDEPESAIWKERGEAAEGMAETRDVRVRPAGKQSIVSQQSRSVKMALGLYRKMTVDERNEVKQAQQEIDNA